MQKSFICNTKLKKSHIIVSFYLAVDLKCSYLENDIISCWIRSWMLFLSCLRGQWTSVLITKSRPNGFSNKMLIIIAHSFLED